MKEYVLFLVFIIISLFSTKLSKSQELKIDHVISVVNDIEKATLSYSKKGFTIKKGRLHSNGLINAHIKFQNKSSYELMSIKGKAKDGMARDYKSLLNNGKGGVFVAISGITTDSMEMLLSNLNINYEKTKWKNWNYITFPKTASLVHFFFIESHVIINDSKDLFKHKNKSVKIRNIYLEGDDNVLTFLKGIGLKYSGKITDNQLGAG